MDICNVKVMININEETKKAIIFDTKYQASKFWCDVMGVIKVETRKLMYHYNSTLSFYIYHEKNGKHFRDHLHAKINNQKVATIYLDTYEIDHLCSKVKESYKKKIQEWVKDNEDALRDVCIDENGAYNIPFNEFKEYIQ